MSAEINYFRGNVDDTVGSNRIATAGENSGNRNREGAGKSDSPVGNRNTGITEKDPTNKELAAFKLGPEPKSLHSVEITAENRTDRVNSATRLFSRENATIYKMTKDGKDQPEMKLETGDKLTAGDYLVRFKNGREFGMHVPENKSGKPMSITTELHGLIIPGKSMTASAETPEEFAKNDLNLNGVSDKTETVIISPHAPLHPIRDKDNPIYVWNVQPGLKEDADYKAYFDKVGHDDIDLTLGAYNFALETTNSTKNGSTIGGHSYGGILATATAADSRSAGFFPNIILVSTTAAIGKDGKALIKGLAEGNGINTTIVRPRHPVASTILLDAAAGDAVAQSAQKVSDFGRTALRSITDGIGKLNVKEKPNNKIGAFFKTIQKGAEKADPGLAHLKMDHSPRELVNLAIGTLGTGVKLEISEYSGPNQVRTLSDFKQGIPVDYSPSLHDSQIHERGDKDRRFIFTSADGQRTLTLLNCPNGGHFVRKGHLPYYDDKGKEMKSAFNITDTFATVITGSQSQQGPVISDNAVPMHPTGS